MYLFWPSVALWYRDTNLHPSDEELTFIHPDDVELYNAWDSRAFELQVANHELLGHGTGKLFQEGADGKKNFDPEKVINPLTGKPV